MKLVVYLAAFFCWPLQAQIGNTSATRSIYLNGVDISSAKHQELSSVNVRIDGQGNIYIEAPHYDVQKETTFLPLGRQQSATSRHLEHKPPTPLDYRSAPKASSESPKADLASPDETSDTIPQTGPASESNGGNNMPLRKDGTRIPPNAGEDRNSTLPEIPSNPG